MCNNRLEIRLSEGTRPMKKEMCAQLNWFRWRGKWRKLERNSGFREGGTGGWLLFGWRTKWIWIEMRVTADRNWDWAAFSLEHTTIKNLERKAYYQCSLKWIALKNSLVIFLLIFERSGIEEFRPWRKWPSLPFTLSGGSWCKILLTIYNMLSCMLHRRPSILLNQIFLWDGFGDLSLKT